MTTTTRRKPAEKATEQPQNEAVVGSNMAKNGLVTKVVGAGGVVEYEVASAASPDCTINNVTQTHDGVAVCDCPDFIHSDGENSGYMCRHIHAVKFAVKHGPLQVADVSGDDQYDADENAVDHHVDGTVGDEDGDTSWMDSWAEAKNEKFRRLAEPIADRYIKSRVGWQDRDGNDVIIRYIEWHTVVTRLNEVFGFDWECRVEVAQAPVPTVTAALTVAGICRTGVGTAAKWDEFGVKAAASDALKRAAVMFGVALELYMVDNVDVQSGHHPAPTAGNAPPPQRSSGASYGNSGGGRAAHSGDVCTQKQLQFLQRVCQERNIDPQDLIYERFQCEGHEVSKKAMSDLLDELTGGSNNNRGGNRGGGGYNRGGGRGNYNRGGRY